MYPLIREIEGLCNLISFNDRLKTEGLVRGELKFSRGVRLGFISVRVIVQNEGKSRPLMRMGTLGFLALACCVFAWGLQYKLSLYEPPQSATHQIPAAKLLSKDEQPSTFERPVVVRGKTAVTVFYATPAAGFLIVFLALSLLTPSIMGPREASASRMWRLCQRAFRRHYSVRPPPVLA
jgi:hypothetical protein